MSDIKIRYDNASRPCPVCGSCSKGCSVTVDGMQFCRGEPSDPAAWKDLLGKPDTTGFRHYRPADPDFGKNVRRADPKPVIKPQTPAAPAPDAKWAVKAAHYAKTFVEHASAKPKLAENFNLPVEAFNAFVGKIGANIHPDGTKVWTFAEENEDGMIIGILQRFAKKDKDGKNEKKAMSGCKRGLFRPSSPLPHVGPVLIPEGASDVIAITHCGRTAVGRPSNCSAASKLAPLIERAWPDSPIVIMGENDARPSKTKPGVTEWPGAEGGKAAAQELANHLGKTVYLAFPPDGAKDARDWIVAQVGKDQSAERYIEAGNRLVDWVEKNREKFEPANSNTKAPDSTDSGRVRIKLSNKEYEIITTVIEVLATQDKDLYQKDHKLVEVIRRPYLKGKPIPPHIVLLEPPNIRTRVTRYVNFIYETKEEIKPVNPPSWLAKGVYCHNFWDGIRPVIAVSTSPVFRADGTVHQTPGYDPDTGILYTGDEAYDPIPEKPTFDDARAALAMLWEGVREFPWREPLDFSVWVSEVITIAVRHAIPGPVPLFSHSANSPGSGKGELGQASSIISTGRELPTTAYMVKDNGREDAVELRKTATGLAIQGHVVYALDNVPSGHGFGSSVLDCIATTTNNSSRELGTSNTPERLALTVWIITGNNIYPIGDTVRRNLQAELLSPEERPHEREYKGLNVVEWARKYRPKLFTACLTVVSAYIHAGRPKQTFKRMGSFDAWSDLVRSAIVWAGLPDPVLTQARFQGENPDLKTTRDLINLVEVTKRVLLDRSPNTKCDSLTCAQIVSLVREELNSPWSNNAKGLDDYDPPSMLSAYREVFPESTDPNAMKLGYLMRKYNGRVDKGKRLESAGQARNDVARWSVKSAGDAGDAKPDPLQHPLHFNSVFPHHLAKGAGDAGDVSNSPTHGGGKDTTTPPPPKAPPEGGVSHHHSAPAYGGKPETSPASPPPHSKPESEQDLRCRGSCGGSQNPSPASPAPPPERERGFL